MSSNSPYKPLGHKKDCKCVQCKLVQEWKTKKALVKMLKFERIACAIVCIIMAIATVPLGLLYGDVNSALLTCILLAIISLGIAPSLLIWIQHKEEKSK